MNEQQWQEYLSAKGAQWQANSAEFPTTRDALHLVDLSPLGGILVQGPDSQKFLQGQLTCDLVNLPANHWTLGAHCNPKGRMISSFRALKTADDQLLLWMPADLEDTACAALAKYAVFFKTELASIGESSRWIGLQGHRAVTEGCALLEVPALTTGAISTIEWQGSSVTVVAVNDEQLAILAPAETSAALWEKISESATPAGYSQWVSYQISQGVPQLYLATSEMFIPQMVNLHVLDGVSFKKGCYTGQEVVARMQYRGASKRRMYRASLPSGAQPEPGAAILSSSEQSVGNVVEASTESEGIELLVVLTNRMVAENAPFRLEDDRPLSLQDLPYDADADPLA